jgi:hypothetical protein
MNEVEEMVQGFLEAAENLNVYDKNAYALGCLQAKYEILLQDYNNLKVKYNIGCKEARIDELEDLKDSLNAL